ncbi:MAG: hypothetical protein AAGJ31_02905 [Verrucomicrobiota bacterium]
MLSSFSWKQHLLGIFVLYHMGSILVGSMPLLVDERGLQPEAWEDPLVQTEIHRWSEFLQGMGWKEANAERVQGILWEIAETNLRFHRRANQVFRGYAEWAGAKQRWRMFPAAVEEPVGFRLEMVEVGGQRRTLYAMLAPSERWRAHWFDRDRMRAALNLYAWGLEPDGYEEFVSWLAEEVIDAFPNAVEIRVGFAPHPVVPFPHSRGEEDRRPGRKWRNERVVRCSPSLSDLFRDEPPLTR